MDAGGLEGLPFRPVWTPVDGAWGYTDQEVGASSSSGRAAQTSATAGVFATWYRGPFLADFRWTRSGRDVSQTPLSPYLTAHSGVVPLNRVGVFAGVSKSARASSGGTGL